MADQKKKHDVCRGDIPWHRRGAKWECDNCADQEFHDNMVWCGKYGNDYDPSLINKKVPLR
jgi:hypothetical protein